MYVLKYNLDFTITLKRKHYFKYLLYCFQYLFQLLSYINKIQFNKLKFKKTLFKIYQVCINW